MRDFTIVISIVIQAFIASFSSAMLLGLLSLYDADTIMKYSGMSINVAMVGPADNRLEGFLADYGISTILYNTQTEAEDAFYRRRVEAIFVVPQNAGAGEEVKLYLPNSDAYSSLIRMIIQEPLKRYENYLRGQNGVEVRYTSLRGKPTTTFEFMYSILIPMLMFFPAFVAGSMVVDSLSEEVENNTLQTLLSAPLTLNRILGAKIVAAVLLAVAQCIAWLALMKLNGVDVQNLPWILLLAMVIAGITTTGAALGAVILRDRERSQFVYSLLLLAAAALSTLLDLSPIKTISRLAIGDPFTSGWNVAIFALFLAGMWLLLLRMSRRFIA
jgi:ABC-type transport system involved in multi-copper enzyme maturation permease subunit